MYRQDYQHCAKRPLSSICRDMPEIVNGVLLRKNEVLLARRSPTRRAYGGLWSIPGGHVEPAESHEQALLGEPLEEAGTTPLEHRRLLAITDPLSAITVYHMFAVTG